MENETDNNIVGEMMWRLISKIKLVLYSMLCELIPE
jgi:hypothetical protein